MENKYDINRIVFNFWNNFLDFKKIPKAWESIVISHKLGSEIPENEIYVLNYFGGWTIISVKENYSQDVSKVFASQWYSLDVLKWEFEKLTQKNIKISGPVISFYLFSKEKLLPVNPYVKKIDITDKQIYDDFLDSCLNWEQKEVDMNLLDSTHRFFVLYQEWAVVSMGNYSIDKETKIAHIGIITPKKYQWKGYWEILVNTIVIDIIDNGLIPQYRVFESNIWSIKIAKSLWFIPILETISLIAN